MKMIPAPEVAAISMQFVEFKLNLWTLIGSQKISISRIDLKILSHKLEKSAQISQQVLLNLKIGYKSYSTLNWTSKYVKTMLVLGLKLVKVAFRNLKYYFLNASLLVFGQAMSFFRLRMCGFCKA